jgi:hypothetical protein
MLTVVEDADNGRAIVREALGFGPLPPFRECPWCGADPGMPCRVPTRKYRRRRWPRVRSTPDWCHYARTVP